MPATHAIHEVCNQTDDDCDLPASWTVTDLGVLPGLQNSEAGGIALFTPRIGHEVIVDFMVVGSSDDGAGNEVGTLWRVDSSFTPPKVSIFDANNFAPDVPSDVTIQAAKGTVLKAPPPDGLSSPQQLVVVGTFTSSPGSPSARATGDPHAFVMTEVLPDEELTIPTVSEWGLAALALLILAAGALIMIPRRAC